jgi:hypothetical protein
MVVMKYLSSDTIYNEVIDGLKAMGIAEMNLQLTCR